MKIFINAGHGGSDSGAVSKNGTKEKDITRIVAMFLCAILIERGYNVEFFQQNKSVNEVAEMANKTSCSMVISIHCNSAKNTKAKGVEVLYYPNSGTGKKLAENISYEISRAMKLVNRGAKDRDNLAVINNTKAPAVIVECAFLSNEDEEILLKNEPYYFASAIAEGIKKL